MTPAQLMALRPSLESLRVLFLEEQQTLFNQGEWMEPLYPPLMYSFQFW